jgi:DNA-binding transcriptional LysR family regulator
MAKIKADLDLHKLEIFYWVAEHKSFSQAAELLSLRQPTVSAHVQELEKAVGGKLLYRMPGKVSLTPLGLMLAERAKNLLTFKRETIAAVEQFHGTLSGELWVGAAAFPANICRRNWASSPRSIKGQTDPAHWRLAGILADPLEGKVEIGYVGFKGDDARLLFEKIWDDEMVVACPWPSMERQAIEVADLQ